MAKIFFVEKMLIFFQMVRPMRRKRVAKKTQQSAPEKQISERTADYNAGQIV